ncbi:MAG: class I SAM-dependent methyltransferase [Ferruginibacter sp.]
MSIEYKPHMLEWTDEKVARFWNFRNTYTPYDNTWFTQQVGSAVLKLANEKSHLKGNILDYGTGKGYLIGHLLENFPAVELFACDFTDSLAHEVDQKYKDYKAFNGCKLLTQLPSSYENDFFDTVFLIETIEHLTDNYLHGTLIEINRILKPGGTVVITTPNNEDLEKTFVHCADCGASFHHMQHVRSWNTASIIKLATQFKFSTIFCKGLNLQWYNKKGIFYYVADQVKKLFSTPPKANLVYIGKKK